MSWSREERLVRLALARLPRMTGERLVRLVETTGEARTAIRQPPWRIAQLDEFDPALADAVTRVRPESAEGEWRYAESVGARLCLYTDPDYPALLKEVRAAPALLTWAGRRPPLDAVMVTVVGSRRPTTYGREVAERLAYDLAWLGFWVVSGLAAGIDACAHRGALRARAEGAPGSTVAVLATGIERIYPHQNRALYHQIRASGALVTEFERGTAPERWNFPRRNRIVSGVSRGVVVVEAQLKSGTASTVNWAADQGRDVFAVPGPITSPLSAMPHRLLREGAILVESAHDLLSAWNMEVPQPATAIPRATEPDLASAALGADGVGNSRAALGADGVGNSWAALGADEVGNSRAALGADGVGNSRAALGADGVGNSRAALGASDGTLAGAALALIRSAGELTLEDLIRRLDRPAAAVQAALGELELAGCVVRAGGQRFAAVSRSP